MDKLYIDFSLPISNGWRPVTLGNRPPKKVLTHQAYPADTWYKGLNLSINLNPDPSKISDFNNLNLLNKILLPYIENETKIQKAIGVYEYGKGCKIHYHIAIKTSSRQVIEEDLIKLFNQKVNARHRTLNSKLFKDAKHRADYIQYMKKEPHNNACCLFIKNL